MTSDPESFRTGSTQRRNLAMLAWIAAMAVLAGAAQLVLPTVKAGGQASTAASATASSAASAAGAGAHSQLIDPRGASIAAAER